MPRGSPSHVIFLVDLVKFLNDRAERVEEVTKLFDPRILRQLTAHVELVDHSVQSRQPQPCGGIAIFAHAFELSEADDLVTARSLFRGAEHQIADGRLPVSVDPVLPDRNEFDRSHLILVEQFVADLGELQFRRDGIVKLSNQTRI